MCNAVETNVDKVNNAIDAALSAKLPPTPLATAFSKTARDLTIKDFKEQSLMIWPIMLTIVKVAKSLAIPDGSVATVTIRVISLVPGSKVGEYTVEIKGFKEE